MRANTKHVPEFTMFRTICIYVERYLHDIIKDALDKTSLDYFNKGQ